MKPERKQFYNQVIDWVRMAPAQVWQPLPLPAPARDRLCVMKLDSGRMLIGTFQVFWNCERAPGWPANERCVSWVEIGD
jgi:hypothetical protein